MWLGLARTLLAAGLITALGAPSFRATLLAAIAPAVPAPGRAGLARRLVILTRAGAALALAALAAVLYLHASALADPAMPLRRVLPLLLCHTRFGQVSLGQFALLGLLLAGAARLPPRLAMALALPALAALVVDGHMVAQYGLVSAGALVAALHLVAAGLWLGSLVPFLLLVATVPAATAPAVAAYFRFGVLYVAVLAGTALIQAICLLGAPAALWHTRYGTLILLKGAGFLLLLGFAGHHHARLRPRLAHAAPQAIARFRLSLTGQALVAVLVITLALWLCSLPPPASLSP